MTRGWERALIAAAGLAVWAAFVQPAVLEGMQGVRVQQARAPSGWEVRARLAELPRTDAPDATLQALMVAVTYDASLEDEDQIWSRQVAGLLTGPERARAVTLAARDFPRRAPPPEAPDVDGDVVALARTLLDTYGYVELPVAEPPAIDSWPGVDRQTRARGIEALAREHALSPEAAHALLAATLAFLDAQIERGRNERVMQPLLAVVMGEAPAVVPAPR